MVKQGHCRQSTDKKETDFANTEQSMTQHNPTAESDLRLKTASVPVSRLHYCKAKQRKGKIFQRTPNNSSGGQFPVIGERVPKKHLCSCDLCDDRAPKQWSALVHCCFFSN